jgi:hypothetical protein
MAGINTYRPPETTTKRFDSSEIFGTSSTSGSTEEAGLMDSLGGYAAIASSLSDSISSALTTSTEKKNLELKKKLEEYRYDPSKIIAEMEYNSGVNGIVQGGLEGAESGSILGIVLGIGEGILNMGVNQSEMKDIKDDWSNYWGTRASTATAKSGFKSGGKIKGAGTSKSDSIGMNVPEGAFIVPKENASKAMEYGKDYLGWRDNEVASRNNGNIDINVSNGEIYYTPEEYKALNYYGVNVDDLAPNAEKNGTGFCRGGKTRKYYQGTPPGGVESDIYLKQDNNGLWAEDNEDPVKPEVDLWAKSNPKKALEAELGIMTPEQKEAFKKERATTAGMKPDIAPIIESVEPDKDSQFNEFMKNVGVIAGAAQAAGGIAGLRKAGERPDINVSNTLKRLSRDAREAANYGLPPAAKNVMKQQSARAYRDTVNEITGRGGSAQEIYNRTIGALSQRLASDQKLELADYQAREAKVDRSVGVDLNLAGQEFDVSKIGLQSWEKDQDVWANLMAAGIKNMIGANQYKREADIAEEMNKDRNTTVITFPK